MAKRLPRPTDIVHVRLELDRGTVGEVEDAAHECRLSLASFCRLVVEMGAADPKFVAKVKEEAGRRLGEA